MRKLFVIFLLVALVPFSVGCGIVDGDDDNPVPGMPTSASTVKLSPSVTLPTSMAANIRANSPQNAMEIPMMFNGVSYTPIATYPVGDDQIKLVYEIVTDRDAINAEVTQNNKLPVTIYLYGQPVRIEIPAPSAGTSSTQTQIALTDEGISVEGSNPVPVNVDPNGGFYVESITFKGANVGASPANATLIASTTVASSEFVITFNSDPENFNSAEWKMKFTKLTENYDYDHENYTEGDYSHEVSYEVAKVVEYTQTSDVFGFAPEGKSLTVALTGSRTLYPGLYKVEFVSTDLTNGTYDFQAVGSKYIRVY
jgi:hypothetical protein